MGVKEDFVSLLSSNISLDLITRDDNKTRARFDGMVGNPPHILVRDLMLEKDCDCLYTVDDLRADYRRVIQNIPITEDGRYLVKTWTVAKTGIDGIKLKQKLDNEVKRVFKENSEEQHLIAWEADNKRIAETWIYNTVFTVRKRVYG